MCKTISKTKFLFIYIENYYSALLITHNGIYCMQCMMCMCVYVHRGVISFYLSIYLSFLKAINMNSCNYFILALFALFLFYQHSTLVLMTVLLLFRVRDKYNWLSFIQIQFLYLLTVSARSGQQSKAKQKQSTLTIHNIINYTITY